MIKKNLPLLIVTSIITILPVFVGLILLPQLPDQIPLHWNIQGEVDQYGSKYTTLLLPVFVLVIQWLCVLISTIEPKKENIQGKPFTLVLWICPLISVLVSTMMYATALGYALDVAVIMPLVMGALFVVIGNYLPKCKQTYSLGIRTPWALADEENWNLTHRLSGVLWVICGIAIMLLSIFRIGWLLFLVILPMTVVPYVYSYLLYKKKNS